MTSEPITVIIVDDEELARQAVRHECRRHPELSVIAECSNGFEAVKAIIEKRPSIVFLDIQMPKLSGFEVLEVVEPGFSVVFVTAHDEHAIRAFDANAVDYLLKPFSPERFDRAVERAVERLRLGTTDEERQKGIEAGRSRDPAERVLVREGSRVHVLPLDRISHIEAQDDYVAVVSGGKKYLKQQTMAEIESVLPDGRFARVHRSSIINLDYLARIELYAKDSRVAILRDGTKVKVSRSGYEKLKGFLER